MATAAEAPLHVEPPAAGAPSLDEIRRRISYLMLFRLAIISLVMGTTLVLAWLSDVDLSTPNSLVLFSIIGATYVLTILYALLLNRISNPSRFAYAQLGADLVVTTLLVHVTGGALSAYTFFYPLSIVGAATVRFRSGARTVAILSTVLFVAISLAGYAGWLPIPEGQRILPTDATPVQLARAIGLNVTGMVAVAFLAVNLGSQIQRTSATLETQRSVAADLIALHEDIVRSLSSGLLTIDVNGRVLTINQAGCEILGISTDETVGRDIGEVVPSLSPALNRLRGREAVKRGEVIIRGPEVEPLALGISITPLVNHLDEYTGRIINFQDLTELRRMEQSVHQAERLAAVGSLAAGIAHEIRNPLASISGSIELLRTAPASDEESQQLMGILTREVDRLNELITDLLDYTNPRPRQLVIFDLAVLCRETVEVFARDRSFGGVEVSVTEDSPESNFSIQADPAKLRQVVWNLLRNAAEAVDEAKGHVRLRLSQSDEEALIEVSDDGPGIPREMLSRVFDPFFTTKSRGSGLGLATCAAIIIEHGGRIEALSTVGQGSRFVIHLPLPGSSERRNVARGAV